MICVIRYYFSANDSAAQIKKYHFLATLKTNLVKGNTVYPNYYKCGPWLCIAGVTETKNRQEWKRKFCLHSLLKKVQGSFTTDIKYLNVTQRRSLVWHFFSITVVRAFIFLVVLESNLRARLHVITLQLQCVC